MGAVTGLETGIRNDLTLPVIEPSLISRQTRTQVTIQSNEHFLIEYYNWEQSKQKGIKM
jgi:hypothetical protein